MKLTLVLKQWSKIKEVRSRSSEVHFCNGDLDPARLTFRLKSQGFRPDCFNKRCVSKLRVGVARRRHRLLKNCVFNPNLSRDSRDILSTIAY